MAVLVTTPAEAVMVTDCEDVTRLVLMVKFAVICPDATVTDAGTRAASVLLLCKVTLTPEPVAAADSVTTPVTELPPAATGGLSVRFASDTAPGGFTLNETDREIDPKLAVMVTERAEVVVVFVAIVTVAEFRPAESMTNCGTEASSELLLEKRTVAPPAGAALASVTVAVTLCPAVTESALSLKVNSGFTVSVAVAVVFASVAVMVAVFGSVTATVEMLNVAELCPKGIVTVVGACAVPVSVTVPVKDDPPPTEFALNASVARLGPFAEFTISNAVRDTPLAEAAITAEPPVLAPV
jgi:hypothetical protein